MIRLGDTVRDKTSGFTGIAVTRAEFINGCVQYDIQPKVGKDNKFVESQSVDEGSLEVIKPKKAKKPNKPTGGPTRPGHRMRGY